MKNYVNPLACLRENNWAKYLASGHFRFYFVEQSTFMYGHDASMETLQDIRKMTERSSHFLNRSGLSGIGAGITALAGAWFGNYVLAQRSADRLGFSGGMPTTAL